MSTNDKKGITVKIDAALHMEVKQYLESHEMTMAEFVTLALQDELHPQFNIKEGKTMGNMRTLAFQVPEELFHKIKDYLQRNNMSQKDFVIGLIEKEIDRDLAQRAVMSETMKVSEETMEEEYTKMQVEAAVSDCESGLEEMGEQLGEQDNVGFSEGFDGKDEESESLDECEEADEELNEFEEQCDDEIEELEEDIEMSM